jgi:hypothetical protein
MCSRLSLKVSDYSDLQLAGRFKTHHFTSNVRVCIFPLSLEHDAQTSL